MRARNVLDVPLPEDLLALRVADLPVRALTKRMLLLAGVNTLADLTEVSAKALEGLEGARDDVLIELRNAMLGIGLRARRSATPTDATLELLRQTCLDRLPVGGRLITALRAAGCSSVADVLALRTDQLTSVAGFGPQRARALQQSIRRIAAIPAARLRSIAGPAGGSGLPLQREFENVPPTVGQIAERLGSAGFPLPRIDARILCAVALANSAEEEIYGLVLGPPFRDSVLLLKRWGLLAWPIPTLDELGKAVGITRERVRQVVARHEALLQGSGLRLPHASALAKMAIDAASDREHTRPSQDLHPASSLLVPVLRTLRALVGLRLVDARRPNRDGCSPR